MATTSKAFIYWDNSSIYTGAQQAAADREGEGVRHRLRLNFVNLLRLAHAERPLAKIVSVGFIPPELRAALRPLDEGRSGDRHAGARALFRQGPRN